MYCKIYPVLIFAFLSCAPKTIRETKDSVLDKPVVSHRQIFYVGAPDDALGAAETPILRAKVLKLITAVIGRDTETVLSQIDDKKGALVDVKAPKTKNQIRAMLSDKSTALYQIFWDDAALKNNNSHTEIESFSVTLEKQKRIDLDFFFYSATECEVRLVFPGRPPSGVMGNPIYNKINNTWKLVSLF